MLFRIFSLGLLLATFLTLGFSNSSEARFLQTDPIGYQDQMNMYAYVMNDPINYTDPSGTRVEITWHRLAFGRIHTAVRMIPENQNLYKNDKRFTNFDQDGNRYAVLSGGPERDNPFNFGNLVGGENRVSDRGRQDGSVEVKLQGHYKNEDEWISSLFNVDKAYGDNLNYDLLGHNSNSYTSGLMNATTGGNYPGMTQAPGYNSPITTYNSKNGMATFKQGRPSTGTRIRRSRSVCVDKEKCGN